MRGGPRRALTGLGLTAALTAALPATGDATKDQCVDANTKGQELRISGKLLAARDQFRTCAAHECPTVVRADCTRRLDELDARLPTIIFVAKDGAGGDLAGVRVSVDGHALTDKLDGSALEVDPGDHVFSFGIVGQPTVERRFVLTEGEKGRRERIVVEAPHVATQVHNAPVMTDGTRGHRLGTQRAVALVAAGSGIAGLAVGGVFGLLARSDWSNSQRDCASATNCPHHGQAVTEHDAAVTAGTVSTIAFVASGALIAGAAVLFFTAPRAQTGDPPRDAAALSFAVAPSVARGGASLWLEGRFR
jgi:hypothetical protein